MRTIILGEPDLIDQLARSYGVDRENIKLEVICGRVTIKITVEDRPEKDEEPGCYVC